MQVHHVALSVRLSLSLSLFSLSLSLSVACSSTLAPLSQWSELAVGQLGRQPPLDLCHEVRGDQVLVRRDLRSRWRLAPTQWRPGRAARHACQPRWCTQTCDSCRAGQASRRALLSTPSSLASAERWHPRVRPHLGGAVHADGQVLGHAARPDSVQHSILQPAAEAGQRLVAVQLCPEGQAARPAPAALLCPYKLPTDYTISQLTMQAPEHAGAPQPVHAKAQALTVEVNRILQSSARPGRGAASMLSSAGARTRGGARGGRPSGAHAGGAGGAPGEDAGHGVGGRGVALLVLPPVPRHCACTPAGRCSDPP